MAVVEVLAAQLVRRCVPTDGGKKFGESVLRRASNPLIPLARKFGCFAAKLKFGLRNV
jgi:hypothetical protein